MNKAELVGEVALKAGVAKTTAERVLNATLEIISETMASDERVRLIGFGSFEVKERAARCGRNPKTNKIVEIPPKRVPTFSPGKDLKEAVNKYATPE